MAKQYGCEVPFKRLIGLAQDDTPGIDPVLHAIEQCLGYDYVVLLQPTSPLRTVENIDGCIEKLLANDADFCVSVTEPEKSPYWMYTVENNKMVPLLPQNELITRRQDFPKCYALNGAVYVARINSLTGEKSFITTNTMAYVMSQEQSF